MFQLDTAYKRLIMRESGERPLSNCNNPLPYISKQTSWQHLQSCAFNRCHLAKVFDNFFTSFMASHPSKHQSGRLGSFLAPTLSIPRQPDWSFDDREDIKPVKKLLKTLARWHRLNAHDCNNKSNHAPLHTLAHCSRHKHSLSAYFFTL